MVSYASDGEGDIQARASWWDLALFVLAAAFMVWGIGSYGLYEPHEAQYGGGASEMVQRGDWVTPYLNGDRELNKPPLFYWLIAGSFWLFSQLGLRPEFVARVPLSLIGLSGIFIAWQWARELWGLRAGRFAALILAVSSGWYIFAHQLLIDELLSVLILVALYLLWKALRAGAAVPWALFYAVVGLAVLAKGLLGLFFPLAILGLFILVRRDWSLIRRCRPVMGILIIACVVGPWAYLFESHNPGALKYIVVNEHLKRAFDTREPHDYGGVQVSAAAFVMFTLIWCSPWSFVLPQVASFSFGLARTAAGTMRTALNDAVLLLVLGALLPAIFVPIPSRLIYYSIPAVPPFAILCAGFWNAPGAWSGWKRALAAGAVAAAGLLCIGASFFLPPFLSGIPDLEVTPGLLKAIPVEALVIGAMLLACGLMLQFRRERRALAMMVVLMGALELFNVGEFSNFDSITSSRKMVEALAPALGDDCLWISEGSDEVGASAGTAFYLRQNTANKTADVLIMGDDPKRPPPVYPGPALNFFIGQKRLDELWTSGKPAVFVTDFKRIDWEKDKPTLPSQDCRHVPLPAAGHRHVYVNSAAWKRLAGAKIVLETAQMNATP